MKKLKPYIKQLFPRVVIALAIVGGLTYFLIWQPYDRARDVVLSEIERREENHSQRKTLNKLLISMRSPGTITTQQQGAFRTYVNETQRAADGVKEIDLIPPPKLPVIRFTPVPALKTLVGSVNNIITDSQFGQRYRSSRVALTTADELLSYHAVVIKALVSVLEYNPDLDFKTFNISSDDTKQRLALAKNGLAKVRDRLNEAKDLYNDPYIDEVISAVQLLEQERDVLEKSGSVSRWSQVFKDEQSKIKNNRAVFWKSESSRIITSLDKVEEELLSILNRWKEIKTTFEL